MEKEVLFLIIDQDGTIVTSATPDPDMNFSSMAKHALYAKGVVDLCRQLDGEPFTECVEVWVRDDPNNMHLLATFF